MFVGTLASENDALTTWPRLPRSFNSNEHVRKSIGPRAANAYPETKGSTAAINYLYTIPA